MELESYFDFLDEDDIRIKGTRVGIEHVVREYNEGAGPEETALHFPTVSLEKSTQQLPITLLIKQP